MGSPEKMKMAYDAGKIGLKEKVAAAKKAAKKAELSLRLVGNSAAVIAQLEEEYDFSGVSGVKEREQAQKWYMAEMPTSSRKCGTELKVAYYAWLKWNLTGNGKPSGHYQGHLIRPLFYEAGPMWHR